jgi:hypothetical protein
MDTTNEPVAWRWKYVKENGEPFTDWQYWHEEPTILNKDKKYLEPLYTHPAKTLALTDDEVMDLWNKASSHPAEFARAILRKAQEK